MPEHKTAKFRAEFLIYGATRWAGNALRFDTEGEALDYADELRGRRIAVDKVRAVRVTTPERQDYVVGSETTRSRQFWL